MRPPCLRMASKPRGDCSNGKMVTGDRGADGKRLCLCSSNGSHSPALRPFGPVNCTCDKGLRSVPLKYPFSTLIGTSYASEPCLWVVFRASTRYIQSVCSWSQFSNGAAYITLARTMASTMNAGM